MKLWKAAGLFSSGTLLSRLTGLVRDMCTAPLLGASPAMGAFFVAFRLSNLFRRILGESPLSSSFIPFYGPLEGEARRAFFADTYASLSLVLLAVIALGEGLLFPFRSNEVIALTMLMLPGLYFICLFGLASARLQMEKRFFFSGAAPALFNLVWIVSLIWVRSATSLALAVLFAFFVQWLSTLPAILPDFLGPFRPFSKPVRQMLRPFGLGVLGVSAMQINSAADALFARFASPEGPAYLFYAMRLYQLPLALIGISLSTALLPRLVGGGCRKEGRRLTYVLLVPATLLLMGLGPFGVRLLYGHGAFSDQAIWNTTLCLWGYAPGLLPASLVLQHAAEHYAAKKPRGPAQASLVSVGVNLTLNALMIFILGYGPFAIALSTSIAAYCNLLWLKRIDLQQA